MQEKTNSNNFRIASAPAGRATSRSILGEHLTRVEKTLDENVNAGAAPGDRPAVPGISGAVASPPSG